MSFKNDDGDVDAAADEHANAHVPENRFVLSGNMNTYMFENSNTCMYLSGEMEYMYENTKNNVEPTYMYFFAGDAALQERELSRKSFSRSSPFAELFLALLLLHRTESANGLRAHFALLLTQLISTQY